MQLDIFDSGKARRLRRIWEGYTELYSFCQTGTTTNFETKALPMKIAKILTRLAVGVSAVEISVNTSGLVMGIIVLSPTQVFAYGAQLEKDTEGLL